jgi:exodeoxyribonuclease-3
MTTLKKIATWNVNSIQVRLPQIIEWLAQEQVDLLALQETKITDELFPQQAFSELGYHAVYSGQKTYNGVALVSKQPLHHVGSEHPYFQDEQKRWIAATQDDLRIINLYVPNGQSLESEKYQYKLSWLEGMTQYIAEQVHQHSKLIILGDFNIAPHDLDVYDPAAWQGQVLVSDPEREAFQRLLNLGLHDVIHQLNPHTAHYTWWDYRQASFRRNLGLRIDHILLSPDLMQHCHQFKIDQQARKAERPSDHAPVMIELNF